MERLAIISWVLWVLVIWFQQRQGTRWAMVNLAFMIIAFVCDDFFFFSKVQFENRQKTQAVYFKLQC